MDAPRQGNWGFMISPGGRGQEGGSEERTVKKDEDEGVGRDEVRVVIFFPCSGSADLLAIRQAPYRKRAPLIGLRR